MDSWHVQLALFAISLKNSSKIISITSLGNGVVSRQEGDSRPPRAEGDEGTPGPVWI